MRQEDQAAALGPAEVVALLGERQAAQAERAQHLQRIAALEEKAADLQRQVDWFKRQLFGRKSERRLLEPDARQLPLAGLLTAAEAPPPPTETVKAYQRRSHLAPAEDAPDERGLRFESSVPVEVIKRTDTGALCCPAAPPAVLEKSLADVSLLAGLLLDKFRYHLPLYRQHQRLAHAGISLSRATLTHWVHRTAELLAPIYHALLSSILQSQVLAMDETPIKAGHKTTGQLQTGYFWPLYGDKDEIAFPFAASRAGSVVREALGSFCGVLVTDGYRVYERFAQTVNGVVHAQCWSHTRRHFVEAEQAEPALVAHVLEAIGALYAHEATLRERKLEDAEKLGYRTEYVKPLVDAFFVWLAHSFT